MNTAVMLIDLLDKSKWALELYYFRGNRTANIFDDLIKLLNYTQSNDLPLVVISPRSEGFDEYLPEVKNHKTFKEAKLIYKDNSNAFTNPEVDEHLKGLGVKQLVLGGYNFFGCVSATSESAYKSCYSLYTAKTILYVSPVTDAAKSEKEVVEGYFKKVYNNVDELAHGLGLH